MATNEFFAESKQKSLIKTAIVSKYFDSWSSVIIGARDRSWRHSFDNRIAYCDLFSGPGAFSDGTESTPLLILRKAIQNDVLRQRLVTVFNDRDKSTADSLRRAIQSLPGVERLGHRPRVLNFEVGTDLVEIFGAERLVPTLFFVDPWGYKGLSLRLINSMLKGWGSDCILFFNFLRVNMGLHNEYFRPHMDGLFGRESRRITGKT